MIEKEWGCKKGIFGKNACLEKGIAYSVSPCFAVLWHGEGRDGFKVKCLRI